MLYPELLSLSLLLPLSELSSEDEFSESELFVLFLLLMALFLVLEGGVDFFVDFFWVDFFSVAGVFVLAFAGVLNLFVLPFLAVLGFGLGVVLLDFGVGLVVDFLDFGVFVSVFSSCSSSLELS